MRPALPALVFILSLVPAACALETSPRENDRDEDGGTAGTASGASGRGGAGLGGSGAGGRAGSGGSYAGTTTAGAAGTTAGTGTAGSAGAIGTSGSGGATGLGGAGGAGGSAGSAGGGTSGAGGSGGSAFAGAGAGGTGAGAGGAAGQSGSGGLGGGAGGSVSTGFDPCPATGPCKILPLGDSITDGIGFAGGYRVELFSLALSADKEITFVGSAANGPTMVDGQPFPRAHEGHSGWTIQQIDGIVPQRLDVDPHIVLLHIGTNDMYGTPAGAPDRLGMVIDQIVAELPDALLVVSNIIPFPSGSAAVSTYNAAVPGVVKTRTDAGKHVVFVDQFTGFPTGELGDGVHPNQAGYARMAAKWYPAISAYLH